MARPVPHKNDDKRTAKQKAGAKKLLKKEEARKAAIHRKKGP